MPKFNIKEFLENTGTVATKGEETKNLNASAYWARILARELEQDQQRQLIAALYKQQLEGVNTSNILLGTIRRGMGMDVSTDLMIEYIKQYHLTDDVRNAFLKGDQEKLTTAMEAMSNDLAEMIEPLYSAYLDAGTDAEKAKKDIMTAFSFGVIKNLVIEVGTPAAEQAAIYKRAKQSEPALVEPLFKRCEEIRVATVLGMSEGTTSSIQTVYENNSNDIATLNAQYKVIREQVSAFREMLIGELKRGDPIRDAMLPRCDEALSSFSKHSQNAEPDLLNKCKEEAQKLWGLALSEAIQNESFELAETLMSHELRSDSVLSEVLDESMEMILNHQESESLLGVIREHIRNSNVEPIPNDPKDDETPKNFVRQLIDHNLSTAQENMKIISKIQQKINELDSGIQTRATASRGRKAVLFMKRDTDTETKAAKKEALQLIMKECETMVNQGLPIDIAKAEELARDSQPEKMSALDSRSPRTRKMLDSLQREPSPERKRPRMGSSSSSDGG